MERRLAAILAADVVGYSRLVGEDEEGTLRSLRAYRETIEGLVALHRGRIFGSAGDSVVAEFASPVEAVRCAADIQRNFECKNTDPSTDCRMQFRIGINLGDVIVEGDDLLGDGVNVAARLEALADAGGICLSQPVFDQVKQKLELGYEYLGEQEFKNIAEPVRVYRVLLAPEASGTIIGLGKPEPQVWKRAALMSAMVLVIGAAAVVGWLKPWAPDVEPASLEAMAFPLPDKPSIAVLPFINMSDDPSQEYFADGMAEDLITDLSQISSLFVIARNSSFSFRGQKVKVRQVAEELGVRYVLEGSVRRAGDGVRINAQLIDATTGGHLWADRYDGTLEDIFGLQDRVTEEIVRALAIKLTEEEEAQKTHHDTRNAEAHDVFLKGWSLYKRETPQAFIEAIEHLEKAIQLDPAYSRAYAALAVLFRDANELRWASQMNMNTDYIWWKFNRYLDLALKDPVPLAFVANAYRLRLDFKHDAAIAEAGRAIALDPNEPDGYLGMGLELTYSGQPEAALPLLEKAKRLDPLNVPRYASALGLALLGMDQPQGAAKLFKEAVAAYPDRYPLWALLAAANGHLGESAAAAEALKRLHKEWGDLTAGPFQFRSIMNYFRRQAFKREADLMRIADGLLRAGLSEQ